jgi:hypothetical protein
LQEIGKIGETESSARVRLWSDMMLQCERQAPAKPSDSYNRLSKSPAPACGKKTCYLKAHQLEHKGNKEVHHETLRKT